ncbi:hypothetical protein [Kocuria rhizophila]|uniref:hypothetical protein n=1 Tax=Kocuria rhizophila TaxID=72000 RepID=UPI0034DB6A02
MRSTKTITLTAAVAALPLLAGCGQGGQPAEATAAETSQTAAASQTQAAGESSGATSTQGTTSSAASGGNAASAAPTETRMASAPEATAGQEGADSATTLPTVEDPCAGTCDETTSVTVNHPTFGPMVIVSYARITTPDTAPQGKQASYAVYQNGNPVGYVASPESSSVITFGNGPAIGDQLWHLSGRNPVDKYGNVYFSSNSGVTVITPTDKGFDSHGTMPGAENPQYPFENAGLTIDSSGEPTVIQHVTDKDHSDTGKTVNWTWDGSTFVAQK